MTENAMIPMQSVGPLKIQGNIANGEFSIPLATYETPLWPSVKRGAGATRHSGGITVTLLKSQMSRSFVLEADSAAEAHSAAQTIDTFRKELSEVVSKTSRFATLQNMTIHQVANQLYIRIAIHSGDASGHNMVTLAAEHCSQWLLNQFPALRYISISGNLCTDKKTSSVNAILGRGKHVIAECLIPRDICQRILKTTPEKMTDLNIKKNLLGSIMAGSLHSANAHYANMLLAFYLATGQDAANIVEGSQGITHAEVRENGLYFSVSLPNIIVGTVGNGKNLPFVQDNLKHLGCLPTDTPGKSANKLAGLCAATVLCGELSLMAAQTNPGELMQSHIGIERQNEQGAYSE